MVGFSGGPSGQEQLTFVVDIVAGDQSGLAELDNLKARVLQLDQALKAQGKSAQESFQVFQQLGEVTGSSLRGTIPAMDSFGTSVKSAKESFQTFAQQGLVPATQAMDQHRQGISRWLIDAGNIHGTLSNLGQAFANLGPQFANIGANIGGIGFGLVGIAQGGTSAALGLANLGAIGLQTFTDLGKTGGEFVRNLQIQSATMGLNVDQTLRLTTAMDLAGGSTTQLQVFMQRLIKAMEDMNQGNENPASKALASLHVNTLNADGSLKDIYPVLLDVMKALNGVTNETERTAIAQQLLGLRGRENQALIRDWPALWALANEKIDEHATLTDNAAEKATRYRDVMTDLDLQWKDLAVSTLPPFVAMLEAVNTQLSVMAGRTREAVSVTREFAGTTITNNKTGAQVHYIQDPTSGQLIAIRGNTGLQGGFPRQEGEEDAWTPGPVPGRQTQPGILSQGGGLYGSAEQQAKWAEEITKARQRSDADENSREKAANNFSASNARITDNFNQMVDAANPFLDLFRQLTSTFPVVSRSTKSYQEDLKFLSMADDQYAGQLRQIKIQTDMARAAQTELMLSGQQYELVTKANGAVVKEVTFEYQQATDKIKALQAAEQILGAERVSNVKEEIEIVTALKKVTDEWKQAAYDLAKAVIGGLGGASGGIIANLPGLPGSTGLFTPGSTVRSGAGHPTIITKPDGTTYIQTADGGTTILAPPVTNNNVTINALDTQSAADGVKAALVQLQRTGRMD